MSRSVDEERAKDRRDARIDTARLIHQKLGRVLRGYEDGRGDSELAVELRVSLPTLRRYRQVLGLLKGRQSGGRWREKGRLEP